MGREKEKGLIEKDEDGEERLFPFRPPAIFLPLLESHSRGKKRRRGGGLSIIFPSYGRKMGPNHLSTSFPQTASSPDPNSLALSDVGVRSPPPLLSDCDWVHNNTKTRDEYAMSWLRTSLYRNPRHSHSFLLAYCVRKGRGRTHLPCL